MPSPSSFWRMEFYLLFLYSQLTAWNLVNVGSIIELNSLFLVLFFIPMIYATHLRDLFLFQHCLFYICLTHNIWALSYISLSPNTWLISYIQQMIVFFCLLLTDSIKKSSCKSQVLKLFLYSLIVELDDGVHYIILSILCVFKNFHILKLNK